MVGTEPTECSRRRFVDAHVHLSHPDALRDLAAAGIVAARDAGSKRGAGLVCRPSADGTTPIIVSAGRALARRGGYGAFLGVALETRGEIAAEIRKLRSEGADIIKIIASGLVSIEHPGTVTAGGFGPDDIRFVVETAGRLGMTVMAHANGEVAIQHAAAAGVRSIEHGFFMTEKALEMLAERNVFWVPTVGALRRAAERAEMRAGIPAFIEDEVERHLEMLGKAFRAGVPLAVGTDCVLPDRRYPGFYQDELAFLRKAGLPDDAVRRIATDGGRELLGIGSSANEREADMSNGSR